MQQGSQEWHDHRASHLNASEAGAVMGANPWQPRNMAELYDVKTGALVIEENEPMRRGKELEPEARQRFEDITGHGVSPVVLTRDRYSASLDGQDLSGEVAAEIKCPMRKDSKALKCADSKDVREKLPHYWWQMVHQQYVSGCSVMYFFAYHPDVETAPVEIPADELVADRDALLSAWEQFAAYLDAGERPSDGTAEDDSEEMAELAAAYQQAKERAKEAAQAEKDAKDALIQRAKEKGVSKLCGAGITVQATERKGSVDYSKIPELEGVDLDYYRKQPTTVWSVK